jgi:hypothetical protein
VSTETCQGCGRQTPTVDPDHGYCRFCINPCQLEEESYPSLVGHTRWNQERTEFVKVLGCYGFGSGGPLYNVSLVNDENIRCPNGLSHDDLEARYPLNTNARTRFERL